MTAQLQTQSPPQYRRIALAMQGEIESGMRAGDQLASEHELARRFDVNRHTVRRAIDLLAEAGLLVRRQGTGTFVTEAPIDYSIGGRTRFSENLEAAGRRPFNRVLTRKVIQAAGGIAEKLDVVDGVDVIHIETLRLMDSRPVCVASTFLPLSVAPAVLAEYRGGSLHTFIERRCGFSPRRAFSLITGTLPFGPDAALLMMPANQPVLRVKSVNVHPETGKPVEYSLSRFRADRLQLCIDFIHPLNQGENDETV